MLRTIERIDAGEMPCPDVVLLDLNLPRRNGTEVLARIRESPSCGQVPVIVVTSSNARRDRETMVRLGASEYFHKPSDYDGFMSLGEVVRRVVGTLGGPQ
jgi:CheY-like chemotaxis protein